MNTRVNVTNDHAYMTEFVVVAIVTVTVYAAHVYGPSM